MKYSYIALQKENDLNKILKNQRSTGETVHLLFHSLWDKKSCDLVELLDRKYGKSLPHSQSVFGVDSFNMPHSFVIFSTTQTPTLVSLDRGKVMIEDYLSRIYNKLRI